MSSHSSSSADHLELRLDGRTVDAATTADVQAQVLLLFDRHAAGLRRYVRACGLPAEAAEDVVQEAFLALFHHLRRGGDSTNLPGWLVRVSYRTALKHRKRLARRQRHELAVDPPAGALADPSADPETHIATRQRRHRDL
ncbi:MAG: RNA polymerase sigma factor, partial [Vicinamibacterales bacterium]